MLLLLQVLPLTNDGSTVAFVHNFCNSEVFL